MSWKKKGERPFGCISISKIKIPLKLNGTMTNAANLTDTNQLVEYCNWLLDL